MTVKNEAEFWKIHIDKSICIDYRWIHYGRKETAQYEYTPFTRVLSKTDHSLHMRQSASLPGKGLTPVCIFTSASYNSLNTYSWLVIGGLDPDQLKHGMQAKTDIHFLPPVDFLFQES